MRRLRSRLTYANVVSSIALFLVLTGATALAASQLGKNSVGSKQLRKNSVTAAKIKRNAVRGAKVKDQSLTGADIKLSTLGTVPSAGSAARLDGREEFQTFTGPGTTTLATAGPFTIKASCIINQGGEDLAELQLFTSVDGAAADGEFGERPVFEVADSPLDLLSDLTATGQPDVQNTDSHFFAVAPDGTVIAGDGLGLGLNVTGLTGKCFFEGTISKGSTIKVVATP